MDILHKDFEQNKAVGTDKQTVIVDSSKTAETDELNSSFYGQQDPNTIPEDTENEDNHLDGEGINEEEHGLDNAESKTRNEPSENSDLNHNERDDLSLNNEDAEMI